MHARIIRYRNDHAGIDTGIGHGIKRVRRNRKFLVAVTGIAVVAVSYIHPDYLEPITEENNK